jgi:hypothetical protein
MIKRALKLRDRIDLFYLEFSNTIHGASNKKQRAQLNEDKEKLLKHNTLKRED